MSTRWIDSPIGGLRLVVVEVALRRIDFDAEPVGHPVADPVLDRAAEQLGQYFAGERTEFDLPLAPEGSPFQRRVWAALGAVPSGATVSYGDLARTLGLGPEAARAVGSANGANPLPIVIPCHRVVGADGRLTGYAGGVVRKQFLLDLEQPGLF